MEKKKLKKWIIFGAIAIVVITFLLIFRVGILNIEAYDENHVYGNVSFIVTRKNVMINCDNDNSKFGRVGNKYFIAYFAWNLKDADYGYPLFDYSLSPRSIRHADYQIDDVIFRFRSTRYEVQVGKPILYFYPETDTKITARVTPSGGFTSVYPALENGEWKDYLAKPDGTLISPSGKEYYCLYWEGKINGNFDNTRGFCVKSEDTEKFLEDKLAELGLNDREANEFIIYWLPVLQKNKYNVISFHTDDYAEKAPLDVTPTPDTVIRVLMTYKPSDKFVDIEPQTFATPERKGFTVVEWGGEIVG